ncbi:MAG: phage portal protein [Bacteroidales bacterium]|nr:phage portal protein [Bacteroidales bacterium]
MGLFDLFLGKRPTPVGHYEGKFKMISGYEPRFTNFEGSIYESELIRASINARATHISKLKVDVLGSARPSLRVKLQKGPNSFQTWSQFLYRLSTILDVHNTAFIVPVYDEYGEPSGIFCPLPSQCEVVQYGKTPYLRYKFRDGNTAAIEYEFCGVMTKFQYKDDVFGESNRALLPTLDLISIENQGIQEATKSSAAYRFWAKVNNFTKTEDLAKERKRFTEENFSKESKGGGMLLFPNTYTDIHQIEAKPWVINPQQMKEIRENVYDYFGVNDEVLKNKAFGDAWTAFYEGAIEPFAIQFSEVMTRMLFTFREQGNGNKVVASSNRLQYLSNNEKLNVSSQMLDRGIMSINDVREIWNLPPVEGGDTRIIRGEYYNADEKVSEVNEDGE